MEPFSNSLVPSTLLAGLFGVLLVSAAAVDIRERRLPDVLTFPLMALGLGWSFQEGRGQAALIGLVAGYLAFVAVEVAFERLRGHRGLGRGDAKLLAAGGAWCGWAGLPLVVLVASASALVGVVLLRDRITDERGRMPFGPFLAFGIAMVWLAQLRVGFIG